nr:hypothetical protein Q903MT_gene4483 [Picea sitchensis]
MCNSRSSLSKSPRPQSLLQFLDVAPHACLIPSNSSLCTMSKANQPTKKPFLLRLLSEIGRR